MPTFFISFAGVFFETRGSSLFSSIDFVLGLAGTLLLGLPLGGAVSSFFCSSGLLVELTGELKGLTLLITTGLLGVTTDALAVTVLVVDSFSTGSDALTIILPSDDLTTVTFRAPAPETGTATDFGESWMTFLSLKTISSSIFEVHLILLLDCYCNKYLQMQHTPKVNLLPS